MIQPCGAMAGITLEASRERAVGGLLRLTDGGSGVMITCNSPPVVASSDEQLAPQEKRRKNARIILRVAPGFSSTAQEDAIDRISNGSCIYLLISPIDSSVNYKPREVMFHDSISLYSSFYSR